MDGSHGGDFMSRAGIEEHLVAFAMSYSSCQDQIPATTNYSQPEPCNLDRSVSNNSIPYHTIPYHVRLLDKFDKLQTYIK